MITVDVLRREPVEVGTGGPNVVDGDVTAGLLAALKGDAGPQGPKGDTGDPGPQGPKGDTGETGPQGSAYSEIVSIKADTTLTADYAGKFIMTTNSSAITITVLYSDDNPIGSEIEIYHHGSGAVYVQSASGCFLIFDGSMSASRKLTVPRFGAIGMKKITGFAWKVSGEATG